MICCDYVPRRFLVRADKGNVTLTLFNLSNGAKWQDNIYDILYLSKLMLLLKSELLE